MSVTVVTGYVPLPCSHRSRDDYEALGGQLLSLCDNAMAFRCRLEDCWLYRSGVTPAGKDSAAYHVVQHQKSLWLAKAAAITTGTLVWLDFGAMHNPQLTAETVRAFLAAVEESPPGKITSPSAFSGFADQPDPCWVFLGTVLVLPHHKAQWFHDQCVAQRQSPTTWEVNTWAAVRDRHPGEFSLYQADHDRTLMTRYET